VGVDDPVLAAVLSALAGPRRGDRVAVVGAGPLVARSLLAASETEELVEADARVVVAGAAYEVPTALTRLAPGGRLVGVAADAAAAQRVCAGAGLVLRHVERVGARVAWSATLPHPT
jgi:protein-L-isoaspartate O-methyltransferase